jgi:parallel beta-helix repeat protein
MSINRTNILAALRIPTGIAAIQIVSICLAEMPIQAQTQLPAITPTIYAQTIYVGMKGSDRLGNGSIQSPFRTITRALKQVSSNTGIIQLSKGTYSLGEIFPLRLPPRLVLRGEESSQGAGVVILGGGRHSLPDFPQLNVAILPSDRSELRGLTITNPQGFGLWIEGSSPIVTNNKMIGNQKEAIAISGNSNALITNNSFSQNPLIAISISNNASPTVRNNLVQGSALGIDIRQRATPQLSDNQIRNNQNGILVQSNSRPWLRQNRIEANLQHGMLVLSDALPDLGAIADPGKNIFRSNLNLDIQVLGAQTLQLDGNQFERAKMQGKLIIANSQPAISQPASIVATRINTSAQLTSPSQPNLVPAPLKPLSRISTLPSPLPIQQPAQPVFPIIQPEFQAIAQPNTSQPNTAQINIAQSNAKSSVIRTTPKSIDQPPTPSAQIDQSLPPVALTPPPGAIVNRPIILAPKTNTPTSAQILARFRVIVPDQEQIEAIRRSFPQAFPSRQGDRAVVQVGAFGDRNLANLLVQNLSREGFQALIELLP